MVSPRRHRHTHGSFVASPPSGRAEASLGKPQQREVNSSAQLGNHLANLVTNLKRSYGYASSHLSYRSDSTTHATDCVTQHDNSTHIPIFMGHDIRSSTSEFVRLIDLQLVGLV